MSTKSNLVNVGRITAVFGIKGWVKVHSYTEPQDNLFNYRPWLLKTPLGTKVIEIDDLRPHCDAYVAHITGVDDLNLAETFTTCDIAVGREELAELDDGEFYWHQLEGLRVISQFEGQQLDFGVVSKILETGANDVLVVQGDSQSMDQKERLVPYVPGQFVLSVDLDAATILVDWDPEF